MIGCRGKGKSHEGFCAIALGGQIPPIGVQALDQRDFLGAEQALELFLAGDCLQYLGIGFEIHQAQNVILLGESGELPGFVFANSAMQIVCHADVERAIAVCEDVDAVGAAGHGWLL